MSGIVKNENKIFTTQLLSVTYKGKEKPLEGCDKCAIVAAFVFGSLLFGIGALLGFGVSYYLRNRKIDVLEQSNQNFTGLEPEQEKSVQIDLELVKTTDTDSRGPQREQMTEPQSEKPADPNLAANASSYSYDPAATEKLAATNGWKKSDSGLGWVDE